MRSVRGAAFSAYSPLLFASLSLVACSGSETGVGLGSAGPLGGANTSAGAASFPGNGSTAGINGISGGFTSTGTGSSSLGSGGQTTPQGGASTNKGGASNGGAGSGGASGGSAGSSTPPPPPPPPPALCELKLKCPQDIGNDTKIACTLEVEDGVGKLVYQGSAGVERRGRSSQKFPKKNYSVELRNASGTDLGIDLLGMGKDSDWVLDGSWADRSFMRNALVFDSYAALGKPHYAAESRFCHLQLNDKSQGVYRLSERIKRDASRVSIAADDGTGQSFIIKQDSEGELRFPLGLEDSWELVYPKQKSATAAQKQAVQAWLDGFASALRGGNPSDATKGVFSYLDLNSTVDYVLLQEFAKNIDAFTLSSHLVRDAGGKASFIPWDLDLSFGQPTVGPSSEDPQGADNDTPTGFIVHRPDLIQILAKVPEFKSKLGPRYRELRRSVLSESMLRQRIDAYLVSLEASALVENFKLFPIEEVDYTQLYEPYSFYRVSSHAEEITHLWTFIQQRLTWLDAHIDAYPNAN
ncbi:MAG TPA: CotH kinase family protein [Polyangiaceae bacterium]|nr:CotH kinase family protein [Polyangiaceae bacterium]